MDREGLGGQGGARGDRECTLRTRPAEEPGETQ